MSNATIEQVYVDAYRDNVRHLAQQKGSKLRQFVDEFSQEAQTGNWDRLSQEEAKPKTRKQVTPESGRVWSRRMAIATPFDDGEITEVEDPRQMLVDPNSKLVRSQGFAMGREFDRRIISAALGPALETVRNTANAGGNTPTSVALPVAQTVGDGTTAMSFDIVTAAIELFNTADQDPDVETIAVIGPRQLRELMNLTEVTSSDFVIANALMQNHIVSGWFGCTWIYSTLLTGTAGERDCFMFKRDVLGLHVPQDVQAFIERDPGLSYAWRPYCVATANAVRIEDTGVVRMRVADTTNV